MREIDFWDWKNQWKHSFKHFVSVHIFKSVHWSLYVLRGYQNTQTVKKYSFLCLFCFKEAEELLDNLNIKYVTCVTYGFSQMHTLIHLLGM